MKVAVEADGPSHFSHNKPHRVLGPTLARNRALQRRGWLVLSVPYFEWDPLGSPEAKSLYLKRKLGALTQACSLGTPLTA